MESSLRGDVNTQYAELRGEMRELGELLNGIKWGLALAVPVSIALS